MDWNSVPSEDVMPGYRILSDDTSLEAESILVSAWRAAPPWEKARQTSELIQMIRQLAILFCEKEAK